MKTTPNARPPQPRVLNFTPAIGDLGATVRLTVGKDVCEYAVEQIPAFPGEVAYNVTRLDVGRFTTYVVRVTSPSEASCDCPGGTYSKSGCKHSHAILKLIELGKVAGPPEPEPAPQQPVYFRTHDGNWEDAHGRPVDPSAFPSYC